MMERQKGEVGQEEKGSKGKIGLGLRLLLNVSNCWRIEGGGFRKTRDIVQCVFKKMFCFFVILKCFSS